jgi:predicted GIY-YIG superfamily endonuclease
MFCIYLLAAGGGIAYAGSSGRIEERMRRHFRGYSSTASGGLRPDAAYVLACTRNRSLAFAWEAWLHKAYRPPYAAKTPAKRPIKPPHPPTGWYTPQAAVYEPARPTLPLPGGEEHVHPPSPPPEIRSRARAWDGVRDGGPNFQRTLVARIRLGDLDLSGCRPVSLCLWGSICVWGPWRTARRGEVVTVHHVRWYLPRSWIET